MISLLSGNIQDNTNKSKEIKYRIKATFTDKYALSCKNGSITLSSFDNTNLISDRSKVQVNLVKDEIYFLTIKTKREREAFSLSFYPLNNTAYAPFEINHKEATVNGKISFKQRTGGTYLYNNVPENMKEDVLNTIIMENKNLKGDCFLTFENQNHTGKKIYMGYRIKNNNPHDIYVTVTNVGYQITGSWLGEKSWMDYYGIKYDMDLSSFKKEAFMVNEKEYDSMSYFKDFFSFDYNYVPSPIQISTYKIPSNEQIYIIGGTTADSYNKINVKTADQIVETNSCINGNAHFIISGGEATGQLCVYDDINKINDANVIVNELRKHHENDDLGGRMGYAPIYGVIDSNILYSFDDKTKAGNLKISYDNKYSDELKEEYLPFEAVENVKKHHHSANEYKTHLSSELNHDFIGEDMVEHITSFEGKEILLSTHIANPAGKIWDYGNWMIEYQENVTFVNNGNNERIIKHYVCNQGSIFYILKDKAGNIIKKGATLEMCTGVKPAYIIRVMPHDKVMVSFQYVLPANNCGSMLHYTTID